MANDNYAGQYKLQAARIINVNGDTLDIKNLIKDFEIQESIFMMFSIYSFRVVDGVRLLETMGATGCETLEIELVMDDTNEFKSLELAIINYSEYQRPTNQSQAYTIRAMNKVALNANIRRISRAVSGSALSTLTEIYSELSNDINIEDSDDEGNFKGIIPNLTYQDAFKFLLSRAQKSEGGLFFFYETLWGGQTLTSYKNIIESESIRNYKLSDNTVTGENDDLQEDTLKKIGSLNSELGMSILKSFKNGGVTGSTWTVDVSTKEYSNRFFNINDETLPKFEEDYTVTPEFEIELSETEGVYNVVNKNKLSYNESFDNFNGKLDTSLNKKKAMYENMFALSHVIDIAGADDIYCGKIIDIDIQQASDPSDVDVHRDEMLSGRYLISEISHRFSFDGVYRMVVKLKRDSFTRTRMMRGGIF